MNLNNINPKAPASNSDLPSPGMIAAGLAIAVEANSTDALSDENVTAIYDAMRTQFHKEQAQKPLIGVTPELEELLRLTTISTNSEEKFIVNGRTLRIEDYDGNVHEERPMVGREAQLIAAIMYLQRLQEGQMVLENTREYIMRHPNEPFFVLLGRDPQAPALVRKWAADRSEMIPGDDKIGDAYTRAAAMVSYKQENPSIGPDRNLYKQADE